MELLITNSDLIHFKTGAPRGINCVHSMSAYKEGNKNDYLGEYPAKHTAQTNILQRQICTAFRPRSQSLDMNIMMRINFFPFNQSTFTYWIMTALMKS